jgi:hypothetical protein
MAAFIPTACICPAFCRYLLSLLLAFSVGSPAFVSIPTLSHSRTSLSFPFSVGSPAFVRFSVNFSTRNPACSLFLSLAVSRILSPAQFIQYQPLPTAFMSSAPCLFCAQTGYQCAFYDPDGDVVCKNFLLIAMLSHLFSWGDDALVQLWASFE